MMRTLAALFLLTLALPVRAQCEIEDWRYRSLSDSTIIEGTTTCRSGWITIRAYDEDGNYLGNARGRVNAYAFDALLSNGTPRSLRIRYEIEDDNPTSTSSSNNVDPEALAKDQADYRAILEFLWEGGEDRRIAECDTAVRQQAYERGESRLALLRECLLP